MIKNEGFSTEKLRELASFREVEAVTSELKGIDGRRVDTNDPKSLEQRMRDLDRKAKLDLGMVHQAFRLELIKAGEGFLPFLSQISLLWGYDQARINRQNAANASDETQLRVMRRRHPQEYGRARSLISIGSRQHADRAHPIADARNLERELLDVQSKVEEGTPGPIGFRHRNEFFVGHMPDPGVFVVEAPRIVVDKGVEAVEYAVPTSLHGIVDVRKDVGKGPIDAKEYGELFTVEDGQLIAHPELEDIVDQMEPSHDYGQTRGPYFGENAILFGSVNTDFDAHRKDSRRRGRR